MPNYGVPTKDKNGSQSGRAPIQWLAIVIRLVVVVAAIIGIAQLFANGQIPGFPLNAPQQFEKAGVYEKEGDYVSARAAYTSAIEQGYVPLAQAYLNRARVNLQLGDNSAALVDASQSIKLGCDPCATNYIVLGQAHQQAGDSETAEQDFMQATVSEPSYLPSYMALAAVVKARRSNDLLVVQGGFEISASDTIESELEPNQQRVLHIEGHQQHSLTFSAHEGDEITLQITKASVDVVMLLDDLDPILMVPHPQPVEPVAYASSQPSLNYVTLSHIIEHTGNYALIIASYEGSLTGDVTLMMTSTNPEKESAYIDLPRIGLANADKLTLADQVTLQTTGQQAFASNGTMFIEKVASQLIVYDLTGKTVESHSIEVNSEDTSALAVSSDGRLAAVAIKDKLTIYNAHNGSVRQTIRLDGTLPSVAAFSPDSATIAIVISDEIRLYNPVDGGLLGTLSTGGTYGKSLAFSHDGHWLAVGLEKGQVQVWDMTDQTLLHTQETGQLDDILTVAFDPNTSRLAAGTGAGVIYVWYTSWGFMPAIYSGIYKDKITSVAFSPNGYILAGASQDGQVLLWNEKTAINSVVGSASSGDAAITAMVFQADGRTLITVADDLQLRFWRVKE